MAKVILFQVAAGLVEITIERLRFEKLTKKRFKMDLKNLRFWLFFLLAVFLIFPGCSSISPLTVTTEMLDSAGNVVSKTTETIADASVAKEQTVHKTLKADTDGYYKALGTSGATMEVKGYQEIALADGSKGYLPLISASFKEAPKRNTLLPTAPSIHPVWGVVKGVGHDLLTYGLADLAAGVMDKALDSSQTKYYGDYNYNPQTAEPYIVNPVVVE